MKIQVLLFNVLFMYVMTFFYLLLTLQHGLSRLVRILFNYYSLFDCPFCTMCLSARDVLCARCDQLLDSFILYSVAE